MLQCRPAAQDQVQEDEENRGLKGMMVKELVEGMRFR